MKYIEELNSGDTFSFNNAVYVLTSDFKSNGNRLCVSLKDGFVKWFNSSDIVIDQPIYILDESNQTIPIK